MQKGDWIVLYRKSFEDIPIIYAYVKITRINKHTIWVETFKFLSY